MINGSIRMKYLFIITSFCLVINNVAAQTDLSLKERTMLLIEIMDSLPAIQDQSYHRKYELTSSLDNKMLILVEWRYEKGSLQKVERLKEYKFKLSKLDQCRVSTKCLIKSNERALEIVSNENRRFVQETIYKQGERIESNKLNKLVIGNWPDSLEHIVLSFHHNLLSVASYAQSRNSLGSVFLDDEEFASRTASQDGVFFLVNTMPVFGGAKNQLEGDKLLHYYIQQEVSKQKYDSQGKVYLSFVIDKEGTVRNVKIENGVNEELDSIAFKIIKSLPKFKPGEQNRIKKKVAYQATVYFNQP